MTLTTTADLEPKAKSLEICSTFCASEFFIRVSICEMPFMAYFEIHMAVSVSRYHM